MVATEPAPDQAARDAPPTHVVERAVDDLLAAYDPLTTDERTFLEARFDAGLAWIHLQPGAGGLGVDAALQRTADTALAAAGAPGPDRARNGIGLGMAAPTIGHHG